MITFAEKNRIMIRESIVDAMKARGITQVQLAEHLGISKSSVNNYLSGRRKISIENIEKALLYLGLEITLKNR